MSGTLNPKGRKVIDNWHLSGNVANYMSRILNRLNMRLLEVLRGHNMTNQHYRIIQVLYDEDNVTIGELSKRMVIAQPVLSRVLTQMESRKLIKRRARARDSRYREIALTRQGREAYEAIWPAARQILEDTMGSLSRTEQAALLKTLRALDVATA